jgi:hypothetical protein
MPTLSDVVEVGKPILLTVGSSNGAVMMVKELAWSRGLETTEYDVEFSDSSVADVLWGSTGDFVIVTNASRAPEENQKKVLELMADAGKTVVVADCKIPSHMPPEKFAHYVKF